MVFVHRLAHLSDIEYHFKCFIEASIEEEEKKTTTATTTTRTASHQVYASIYLDLRMPCMAGNVESNFRPNSSSTLQDNSIWQSCQVRNPMQ